MIGQRLRIPEAYLKVLAVLSEATGESLRKPGSGVVRILSDPWLAWGHMWASFCLRVPGCSLGTEKTLPAGSWQGLGPLGPQTRPEGAGWKGRSPAHSISSPQAWNWREQHKTMWTPSLWVRLSVNHLGLVWCPGTSSPLKSWESRIYFTATPHSHPFAFKTGIFLSHDSSEGDCIKDNEMQNAKG